MKEYFGRKRKEIETTIDKDLCIEQIKIQHNLVNKEHKNILEIITMKLIFKD